MTIYSYIIFEAFQSSLKRRNLHILFFVKKIMKKIYIPAGRFISRSLFSEFSVGVLEEVTVDLKGLGFLNWVVKKVMEGVVIQNTSSILITSARKLLRKEFRQVYVLDQMLQLLRFRNFTLERIIRYFL